eukprot:NODE_12686_length_1209_cov_6.033272.p1 GENE.NODE_12686_length_1209_cov_6.033272~~NODE_12686_length_1209_cov_6.033272.p1  ORF type:complete len:243 (+),score=38.86 NODE_12686_length_1209_cov_6.033272:88-729(+)
MPSLYQVLHYADPYFGMPLAVPLGVFLVCLLCLCLVMLSWAARSSMAYFASAPEPEGDIAFYIAADGRRVDELPPTPWPQRLLGAFIWLAGVGLLLRSTRDDVASALLTSVALLKNWLLHVAAQGYRSKSAISAHQLRGVVTEARYREETRNHTHVALQRLRVDVARNPLLGGMVSEKAEGQLMRFVRGGPHCPPPFEPEPAGHGSRWFCVLL